MKRFNLLFVVIMLFIAAPAFSQERSVDLTGWVTWTDISGDNTIVTTGDDVDFEFDSEQGFGAAINVFWGERISTEFAVSVVEPDVTFASENPLIPALAGGTLEMMPITATLQWHFSPEGRIDPYIGVGAAYVLFDDIDDADLDDIDVDAIDFDDDVGFVVNAGLSFDITGSFAINADVKYMPVETAATAVFTTGPGQAFDIEVNPLIVAAGVQFQF